MGSAVAMAMCAFMNKGLSMKTGQTHVTSTWISDAAYREWQGGSYAYHQPPHRRPRR
jgi:hypothetical protein